MVVSFNIYEVMSVVELIAGIVFLILFCVNRDKTWNKVIRLSLVSGIFFINLFRIPMEIQMNKSYAASFVIVILCFFNAVIISWNLGNDK